MTWQEKIEDKLQNQKNKVVSINIDKETVSYSEKIILHRQIEKITGAEEISRAFLIDRLINELDLDLIFRFIKSRNFIHLLP